MNTFAVQFRLQLTVTLLLKVHIKAMQKVPHQFSTQLQSSANKRKFFHQQLTLLPQNKQLHKAVTKMMI
jgi:hypothetical protein